jgi:hypothetical protein
MKYSSMIISAVCAVALAGCAAQASETAVSAAATTARPVVKPAPTDNLMKISCADFLATAKVAVDETDADAAKAAQDELANGLTWLHGYLYAKNNGAIEVLSQEWMKATVTKVHANCTAAKDAAGTSLFEVATS